MQNSSLRRNQMPEQEEAKSDRVLPATLGLSLFLHLFLLIFVMNVELPPPPSQEQYAEWVKRIASPPREAVVMPVEEAYRPDEDAEKVETEKVETKGGGAGGAKGAPRGAAGGGKGSPGAREGVRRSVSNKGVLGVIGVASEGGGEFADVFSDSSGGVSEDLGSVMEGKRSVALPGAGSQISRKSLKGGGGDGDGGGGGGVGGVAAADIGNVGTGAGGSVRGGSKKDSEVPVAQVGTGEAAVTGGVDKKSASSALARKASGFRRCYERGLKANPSLRGKLVFELTIDANGRVIEVRFVEDTMRSREVSDCVKGILMRMTFGKSDGIASIRNTLVFEPQK